MFPTVGNVLDQTGALSIGDSGGSSGWQVIGPPSLQPNGSVETNSSIVPTVLDCTGATCGALTAASGSSGQLVAGISNQTLLIIGGVLVGLLAFASMGGRRR